MQHGKFLGLALTIVAGMSHAGDKVYQYHGHDGVPLFTDQRLPHVSPIKITYYGRPTAVGSCNLNSNRIQKRMHRYTSHIEAMADRYEVPVTLIKAVIAAESCFNPKAVSRVGAQGLMQLMPNTAKMLGVTDSFDPKQNIRGGVSYLRMLLDRFDQDEELALAAYNAGPQAVKKYGRIPPFKETQRYVKKVMRLAQS